MLRVSLSKPWDTGLRADGTAGSGPINGSRWTQEAVLPQPWLGRASSFSFGSCGRRQRRAVVVIVVGHFVNPVVSSCQRVCLQVRNLSPRDKVCCALSRNSPRCWLFVVGADKMTKCELFGVVILVVILLLFVLRVRLCFWRMSDKRLRRQKAKDKSSSQIRKSDCPRSGFC